MKHAYLVILPLAIVFFACFGKKEEPLRFWVASSAGPAALRIREEAAKTGIKVEVSAASSSLIAKQIANGAPCDVVLLADEDWMRFLEKNSKISKTTQSKALLSNRLVLIAKQDAGLSANAFFANKFEGKLALADPAHVPAGKYAKEALSHLADFEALKSKLIRAQDARAALYWVEQGEAQYGVVYSSDAKASNHVRILYEFEPQTHPPIRYPLALCKEHRKNAQLLLDLVQSVQGRAVFEAFGFETL